jgi:hypothetical protein
MINNFHRCSICKRTDNEEVETHIGDYTTMPFVPDPSNSMFDICMECYEEIGSTLFEYEEVEDYDEVEES